MSFSRRTRARARPHIPAGGYRIVQIAGIGIFVDPTFIISMIVLTMYASREITTTIALGSNEVARLAISVLFAIALVLCIVAHELAHSLVARAYGMPVRRIVLFAFGGVSQIEREAHDPKSEYTVAMVGPLTSIVIAAVCGGIARVRYPHDMGFHGPFGAVALLNVYLAAFNLIPALPLDGGRILRSGLWAAWGSRARATRAAATAGRIFAVILVGAGIATAVYAAISGSRPGLSPLWALLIGVFIYNAATATGRAEGTADADDAAPLA